MGEKFTIVRTSTEDFRLIRFASVQFRLTFTKLCKYIVRCIYTQRQIEIIDRYMFQSFILDIMQLTLYFQILAYIHGLYRMSRPSLFN